MVLYLKGRKGQTSLEYLLLMSVAFITAYILITGPIGRFTNLTLLRIRGGIQNTVRNGEWREGEVQGPGEKGHPGDPDRLKPVHF